MNPKCILIVDDDPDQRLTIRLPLEAAGYAISRGRQLRTKAWWRSRR